ncbi:MAG TPA: NAD-dependent epimerase/dehydratase family protein, partial [Chloroflexota bacterium]|nr:NAD-dependent epimerase/dehydratase family protein [Chloroflexota bacterium]
STGQPEFLTAAEKIPNFRLVRGDNLDLPALTEAMKGSDTVFHLAANADVRFGLDHPRKDLEQNTIATFNVLEAMRAQSVRTIAFSSTGSIYGEPDVFPTPETCPFPLQTSLYGASKLAGEGLISAYAHGFGIRGLIFRFASVLGPRYTHGHVFDFYKKLLQDPDRVEVLGNGRQRKSYLHVSDCVDAILIALAASGEGVSIYNLGTDEYCTVDESLGWICSELGLDPRREYSGGERGWPGDSPFIFLDCSRINALGWRAKHSIHESVVDTLNYLRQNQVLLASR